MFRRITTFSVVLSQTQIRFTKVRPETREDEAQSLAEVKRNFLELFWYWHSPPFPELNLSSKKMDGVAITSGFTTYAVVKANAPPVYRPFRRLRYRWHVQMAVRTQAQEQKYSEIMAQLNWENSDLAAFIALIGFDWFVVYAMIIFFYILFGFGKATKPKNEPKFQQREGAYNPKLLPANPEEVARLMGKGESFVLVEGPKGTGKTTLLKETSRLVSSPLLIPVKYDANGKGGDDYVYYYVASQFHLTEFQARCILSALKMVGRPAHLFFDIESVSTDFNLAQHCKHVKSLVADIPTIHAVIASSDGKTGGVSDPRMYKISSHEMTIEEAKAFLEAHGMKESTELELETLLNKYPRTPLCLWRDLLPYLDKPKDAKAFVNKELEIVRKQVESVFKTCQRKDELVQLVIKERNKNPPSRSEVTWGDVQELCGSDFKYAEKKAFIEETVQESQLFRPTSSVSYEPRFDQTVEAFARAKF